MIAAVASENTLEIKLTMLSAVSAVYKWIVGMKNEEWWERGISDENVYMSYVDS